MKYNQMQLQILRRCILRSIFRTKATVSSDLQSNHEYTNGGSQGVALYKNALVYNNDIAIKDFSGKYTYLQLYQSSKELSRQISNICGSGSNLTVAFFSSPDILPIVILWATWMSGQKGLALNSDVSQEQFTDLVKKTNVSLIVSSNIHEKCSRNLAFENSIPLINIDHKFLNCNLKEKVDVEKNKYWENEIYNNLTALITCPPENISITTLITRKKLKAIIKNKIESCSISRNDKVLCICPSFSSHSGEYIFNLLAPISVGCQIHIYAAVDSKAIWRTILGINSNPNERVNTLIAEPIVFQQLILQYDQSFAGHKNMMEYIKNHCVNNIRVTQTCFYRCDPITFDAWHNITGHRLQESDYLFEDFTATKFDESSQITFRLVNPENKVLLEMRNNQNEKFPMLSTPVIGRLMTSNNGKSFYCTGKIVCYCNQVFKTIGRYACRSN